MTIQSQLDQVLALAEKATPVTWSACERGFGDADLWFTPYEAWSDYDGKLARGQLTLEDAQLIAAAVNFLRQHGPAIRAAVGGVGETVAWWREDHVCHAHELTTADALADGYKPCVIKCEDCAWNASLCDTHGAVGVGLTEAGRKLPAGKYELYASPTATVDVGVIRELVQKWRGSARGGSQYSTTEYEDGCTAELRRCADELAALIGKEA